MATPCAGKINEDGNNHFVALEGLSVRAQPLISIAAAVGLYNYTQSSNSP